ncbi:MAG: aminotransferase class V-fold PLP-dependent enzyme [Acidimicrobiia bacterium]
MIYLDAASTAPTSKMVQNAIIDVLSDNWGNVSGAHQVSARAKNMLEEDREKMAQLIEAKSENIVFTSGATEALNIVLQGFARKNPRSKIFYSAIEHDAVFKTIEYLSESNIDTVKIAVDSNSIYKRDFLNDINEGDLVCIMPVNNETGVINDVIGLAEQVHERKGLVLFDAVQSIYSFDPIELISQCDFAIYSGHKLGAPHGVGMLYVRDRKKIDQLTFGGSQEWEVRPGTTPAFLIHALRIVFEDVIANRNVLSEQMKKIKKYAIEKINVELPFVSIRCSEVKTSNHIISLEIYPIESQMLVAMLSNKGICISKGSACASGASTPSRVLLEMGIEKQKALSTIRLSFLPDTTEQDIDMAINEIKQCVDMLSAKVVASNEK